MNDEKKLEIFRSAPIPKAVMRNALQAMGAARGRHTVPYYGGTAVCYRGKAWHEKRQR